jgi:S1-C subfamily serine protease
MSIERDVERHHSILYVLVVILLVMQTVSFLSLSGKVTRIEGQFIATTTTLNKSLTNLFHYELDAQRAYTQQNFQQVTKQLSLQQQAQQSLTAGLEELKSSAGDFSGIIAEAVTGVVSIATDKSMGTGFFVHTEGYIVTNQHVIAGAKQIQALTSERKVLTATVLGQDSDKDVALLKVSGSYSALPLANSQDLAVGNKVIAIGNPLGLAFTVTEGIISALHRRGPNGREEYVQTDVSLNPGNSGGPLLDTKGRVVGMNNFKVGEAESLGFALESNALAQTVNALANTTLLAS